MGIPGAKNSLRTSLLRCMLTLCALAFVLCATGCVYSDTITEHVYDSDPSSIVDPSLAPILINTVTAEMKTDALPRLDNDEDSQEEEKEEENLPVFDGDTTNALPQMAAARAEYVQQAANMGAAETTSSDNSDEGDSGESDAGEGSESGDGGGEEPGDGFVDIDEEGQNPGEGEDEEPHNTEDEQSDNPNQRSSGTGDEYTYDEGDEPVIPDDVNRVAATGNNAVIVAIVAGASGSDVLVACDSDTKAKTSNLLASQGINEVEALWDNDGSSSGDLSEGNLERLCKDIAPDQVFVTSGSKTLTKAQKETLKNDYNINVYELPELSSATAIRTAVEIVGKTLATGGVDGAEANYKNYLDAHDALISKYANDGIVGGFDFDLGEEAEVESSELIVTLYVDGWDSTARYRDHDGYLDTSSGVATATLGYAVSPINYYLSVGGVLNNAASQVMRKELKNNSSDYLGSGVVWQFSSPTLPSAFTNWSKLNKKDLYDLGANITGGRFKSNLTWYTSPDGADNFGLGTARFPALIARDQFIAGLLIENASQKGKAYYPYGNIRPANQGTLVGYWPVQANEPTGRFVESCIGAGEVAGSALGDDGSGGTTSSYGIYVNPKGLVQSDSEDELCSWTMGSPESVLEASWAHWKFKAGSEEDFDYDVIEFYRNVYGYEITEDDLAAIKAGAAA